MGRRHKVDIVRAPGDEFTVNLRQPLHGYFYPPAQFGYFIILAIHAGQVAPRKKTVPAPLVPLIHGSSQ